MLAFNGNKMIRDGFGQVGGQEGTVKGSDGLPIVLWELCHYTPAKTRAGVQLTSCGADELFDVL